MSKEDKGDDPLGNMEPKWTNDWSIDPLGGKYMPDVLKIKDQIRLFGKPIGKFKCVDCKKEYPKHFNEDEMLSCPLCKSENIETILFEEVLK